MQCATVERSLTVVPCWCAGVKQLLAAVAQWSCAGVSCGLLAVLPKRATVVCSLAAVPC